MRILEMILCPTLNPLCELLEMAVGKVLLSFLLLSSHLYAARALPQGNGMLMPIH